MNRTLARVAAVGAACVGAVAAQAAVPADASGRSIQVLSTVMTGATEVPGPGDADGFGFFGALTKGDKLCYVITAKRIEPATLAHIHDGPRGVAGPIVVALRAPTRGFAADCLRAVPDAEQTPENAMMTLTDSELAEIKADPGEFYINVHNTPFPAGAIRGQLR